MAPWRLIFQVLLSKVPASYLDAAEGPMDKGLSIVWPRLSFLEHVDHPRSALVFIPRFPAVETGCEPWVRDVGCGSQPLSRDCHHRSP